MDIIKAFKLEDKEHQINIRGTIDQPLFQANQIGELIGIKNINTSILHFDEDYKKTELVITPFGQREIVFLTEFGLYRLLSNSTKPIALIFQKWVFSAVKEIRTTGTYKLKEDNEVDKELMKSTVELSIHNTLIKKMKKRRVVYLSRIRQIDENTRIIKIGSSDDINRRSTELINAYGESTILEVFECNDNRKFELYLQNHTTIKSKIYKEPINGHFSREMFTFSDDEYKALLKLIKSTIHKFTGFDADQYLELEKIKLEKKKLRLEEVKTHLEIIKQNEKANKILTAIEKEEYEKYTLELESLTKDNIDENKVESIPEDSTNIVEEIKVQKDMIDEFIEEIEDHKSVSESVDSEDEILYKKQIKRGRGPRIQQYDPNTLQLLRTFDTVVDIVREINGSSASAIRSACKINNVYRGYRWFSVERSEEDKQYEIPPTVKIMDQRKDLIAELNLEKNKIVKVYSSQKEAAQEMKLKSSASINSALKESSLAAHRYWNYFDDCSDKMKEEYLKNNTLPEPQKPKGVGIEMLDIKTKKVVERFDTMNDVIKKYHMGRGSLKNAIENKHSHNGYLWRFATTNDDNTIVETQPQPEKNIVHETLKMLATKSKEETDSEKSSSIDEVEKEEEKEPSFFSYAMLGRSSKSDSKIQKYDSKTLQYIQTYDFLQDIIREVGGTHKKLNECIEKNYEYKGFRWFKIKKTDEDKEYEIPPTEEDPSQVKQEFIVLLNKEKTMIKKMYYSLSEVAEERRCSKTFVTTLIKSEREVIEGFFKYKKDCDEYMIEEYLKENILPSKPFPKNVGYKIQMIHPTTKEVVESFSSIQELTTKYPMGRPALNRALNTNKIHNGYYWKSL